MSDFYYERCKYLIDTYCTAINEKLDEMHDLYDMSEDEELLEEYKTICLDNYICPCCRGKLKYDVETGDTYEAYGSYGHITKSVLICDCCGKKFY